MEDEVLLQRFIAEDANPLEIIVALYAHIMLRYEVDFEKAKSTVSQAISNAWDQEVIENLAEKYKEVQE